ncbi:hypothetical protein LLEC1_04039 [Akanthomyces lecanii]|uniref:Uncharacterized protein n=1 Tax=Cordyceps confragosa TaxID=2714763 RepID=A0A179I2A5_CORDF|nr:hypothetical protein LLEC1_04039 [Akanthomyces lecanii]
MARFTFAKGRKKPPSQIVLTEPTSKAHKILGSTPISIDSPKPWDDTSSGFSGGTGNSTATSYASTEDDYSDHHVAIAPSEDEWSSNTDILPAIIESRGLDSDSDRGMSDMTHSLRKTQSSSTIRSRYDKSTQPLPTLPQTSAPPMAKGVQSKIHKMLDLQSSQIGPPLRKKPPMLDFSNLRNASRLSRKGSHGQLRTDGTVSNDIERSLKSPSIMSLMTPTGKPRKIQKRNTKDGMLSPALEEGQRPLTSGARRRGSSTKQIPSLYDHYEQMSLRQIMQEAEIQEGERQENDEIKDEAEPGDDDDDERGAGQDLQWLHDVLPTPSSTALITALTPATAHGRSNSTASKVTANTKRSRNLDRTDLQETSMLMLSSDSEEEAEPAPLPQSQTNSPKRRASTSNVSPRTVSRTQTSRAPSQASTSDYRPVRHTKRTSFAPANTYFTIPNSSRLSIDTAIQIGTDSRSSTPYTDAASCRTSLLSDISSASALHPSSNYLQEARAVTMLAGRQPSRVEYGEEDSPDTSSSSTSLPLVGKRKPSMGQTQLEELTPPLSPSSVDFYIRSARSSIDGPGSNNRYMAVTRQEEMLISALRNKKQHNQEQSAQISQQPVQSYSIDTVTEKSGIAEREEGSEKERDEEEESEADSILGMENLAAEAIFGFGFPAPPTARKQSFFENGITASASISSFASTVTTDKLSQSSIAETESILNACRSSLTPALAQMTLKSILRKPAFDREEPEQQEVILYLDDAEPSPDLTDFSEFGYVAMSSLQSEHPETSLHSSSPVADTLLQGSSSSSKSNLDGKRVDRSHPSAMASVPEDGELEYDEDDIPRPDSPVSPDAFPAVPQIRTTLSSMARLSAVGSSPMMAEPGWWGDDD